MMDTLGDALPREITRCKELLTIYEEMGPAGTFGVAFLKRDIEDAEKAIADNDLVAMVRIYPKLKGAE